MDDRTFTFEAGGKTWTLCLTQRARRRLDREHGIKTVADISRASGEGVGLEVLLYELLEGARYRADPKGKPYPAADVEALLDEESPLTLQGHVLGAVTRGIVGPKAAPEADGAPKAPGA